MDTIQKIGCGFLIFGVIGAFVSNYFESIESKEACRTIWSTNVVVLDGKLYVKGKSEQGMKFYFHDSLNEYYVKPRGHMGMFDNCVYKELRVKVAYDSVTQDAIMVTTKKQQEHYGVSYPKDIQNILKRCYCSEEDY